MLVSECDRAAICVSERDLRDNNETFVPFLSEFGGEKKARHIRTLF